MVMSTAWAKARLRLRKTIQVVNDQEVLRSLNKRIRQKRLSCEDLSSQYQSMRVYHIPPPV